MDIPEITPEQLAQSLGLPKEQRPFLLDVRTPSEHAHVALPGSVLIPLYELEERLDELEDVRGRDVVVYCHHGVRSLNGAALVQAHGLSARSLRGGIDAYSVRVDPSLRRY